ncbi:MAG: RNA polymerase factor sigma-54 [Candidatus Omnitrophica bacterium]|nr:RNA polymerase factor sigma-54 [Candidatus Omnitrophota bacterium]
MQILQLPIVEIDQLIAEEIASNPLLEDNSISLKNDAGPEQSQNTDPEADSEAKIPDNTVSETSPLDYEKNKNFDLDENIWSSDFTDRNKVAQAIESHNFQETLITKPSTFQEELLLQFRFINDAPEDVAVAEEIIGNIDENGYLAASLEEIAAAIDCSMEKTEKILKQIQSLDPAGIGARDLKECLLIQLRRQGKSTSIEAEIVEKFLNELAAKKYALISKALKISLPQVKKHSEHISRLDPKPCRNYAPGTLRIVPDVILEKTPEGYEIIINTKNIPELSISQMYKKLIKDKACPKETVQFIKEKLTSAQNLINGLQQRHQTLEKVTTCIFEYQDEFLEKGLNSINPLTHKDVAEKLGVHPSTISRTVANKYIQTPFGTYALKVFFSQAIPSEKGGMSNQKVKAALDEIIKTEPDDSPLRDQEIVDILTGKGMRISRRTATKYRNALKIPPAHLRRK